MSKEQESFDRIKLFIDHMNDDFDSEDVSAVDNALERLEEIDNADPSEALECLELMGGVYLLWGHETVAEGFKEEINTIKQALLKAQKEHKVLEIIKELLGKHFKIELVNGGTYYQIKIKIMGSGYSFGMSISKVKFDLLKKVLE